MTSEINKINVSLGLMTTEVKYRKDIDGLRALAVLSVVIFHAFPAKLKGGFVGVDVFFVISGFLITSILARSVESHSFSYWDFYQRRIRRLFPALLVVFFSAWLWGWLGLFPFEFASLGKHIAAGAGFLSNVLLWSEAGYFDSAAEYKPFLHFWSLGIEEQFYLIWPWLLVLGFKLRKNLRLFVWALTLLSFGFSLKYTFQNPSMGFYLPYFRFWELSIGGLIALYSGSFTGISPRMKNSASITALFMLLFAIIFAPRVGFPGYWALIPTLGAALLIVTGPHAAMNRLLFSLRPMVLVGLISYPLYLWHWPILVFLKFWEGGAPGRIQRIVAILASLILATLTYLYVEKPLRHQKSKKVLTGLISGMVVIFGLGVWTSMAKGFPARMSAAQSAEIYQDIIPFFGTPEGTIPCDLKMLYCLKSQPKPADVLVWGDSHAFHFFDGLIKRIPNHSWQVSGHNSCPPLLGVNTVSEDSKCLSRNEEVFEWIKKSPELKTVVLTFFGSYFLETDYAADHTSGPVGPSKMIMTDAAGVKSNKAQLFERGLRNTVSALTKLGKNVVLIIDIPELAFFPKVCVNRPMKSAALQDCSINRVAALERQMPLREMVLRLKNEYRGMKVFDPMNALCGREEKCSLIHDGILLYVDSNHMSRRGSVWFAGFLDQLRYL